jgi:hypothetical protein
MVNSGPAEDSMTSVKSVKQNSKTRTKIHEESAPRKTARTMVFGALMLGPGVVTFPIRAWRDLIYPTKHSRGISSIMWLIPSKPVRPKVLCSRPRMKATPAGHPVSFWKVAKTKLAGW